MNPDPRVVFVGQGPNRASWLRGVALAKRLQSLKRDPDVFVQEYCRRLAVTGAVGRFLAGLLGISLAEFYRTYQRRNLNARFNGKAGKGDVFDVSEGRAAARDVKTEAFPRMVLLGANVARCFGLEYRAAAGPEIAHVTDYEQGFAEHTRMLLLPHPSRVVLYWNDPANVERARAALRQFVFNP